MKELPKHPIIPIIECLIQLVKGEVLGAMFCKDIASCDCHMPTEDIRSVEAEAMMTTESSTLPKQVLKPLS